MNRRDLLKTALWSVPALLSSGLSLLSCSGSSGGAEPTPGPPNPPPCTAGIRGKGLSFASPQRLNGILPSPQTTASGAVSLGTYFSLDDSSFLSRLGYGVLLPPIGNQGQQSSCVGWGVGYAAGTAFSRLGATSPPPGLPSPSDLYAKLIQLEQSVCGNGTLIADALDLMVVEGIATLASSPYSDQVCSIPSIQDQIFLNGYSHLDPSNFTLLKTHISNLSVIPLGIVVYPDFETASGPAVYSPSSINCSLGGHCVALVGYDDSRQAFRIMNSWGTGWGDNGFLWIAYHAFSQIVQEAYLPTGPAWPTPVSGTGNIVPGSVASNGSIEIAAAVAISWSGPDPSSSTPWLAFINFALSGPLRVSSVQIQFQDANPADTFTLGSFNVQQWSRTISLQLPLTTAQDQQVFGTSGGTVLITVSGVSAAGQSITTSCKVTPTTLR